MQDRLQQLINIFQKEKLDALIVSSIPNIIYLTFLSGFSKDEREAFLFITKNEKYILTDGRYSEAVKSKVPDFKLIEISSKISFEEALKTLVRKHNIKRLGFDGDNISFLEHKKLSRLLNDLNHFTLGRLRTIKSATEIIAIEKACNLGDKTFKFILGKIKKGVSEKELTFEIEFFIKKHGSDISFPPIVAFGKNSSVPHHVPTNNKLTNNQIVLLDFGVKYKNYCSDMTRTVFFGKPTIEQKRMYETVLLAQQKAIEFLSGKSDKEYPMQRILLGKNVDKVARDYIISKGYSSIPHSVGHGIGLEVHEAPHISPNSKDILKEGMVFSIEPGIYMPGFGGVRIEDLVVLEKNGPRLLTHSPKNIVKI